MGAAAFAARRGGATLNHGLTPTAICCRRFAAGGEGGTDLKQKSSGQWLVVSGGVPTIHHNPAKPNTWLAIACVAAILLILPILSIHV